MPLSYKPQLDSLRAIAVSAVMVHHFLPMGRIIPEDFLTLGLLAVRLFFVLSGYLITGILLESRKAELGPALREFYTRRGLRILPIYYLTIFVLCALSFPPIRDLIYWHLAYASNVAFVIHPEQAGSAAHLWSLSVEEQFYLIWPLLILLVPAKHVLKVIVGAIAVGLIWKTATAFTPGSGLAGAYLMPACLDSLGIGALLAFCERGRPGWREKFMHGSLTLGAAIVVLQVALYVLDKDPRFFWSTSYLGVSLIFVWLVGRAADGFRGGLGALLELKPVLYIGKISYGIYLYHNFVPGLIRYVLGRSPSAVVMFLLACGVTVLIASLSWYLIELPIKRWRGKPDRLSHGVLATRS